MNILVCDNIRDMAMQLHKQIERQLLDPATTKEEREKLVDAKQSMTAAIRYLLQVIEISVKRGMSKEGV